MTPEAKLTAAVLRYLRKLKADGLPIWWVKIRGDPMQRRGLPDLHITLAGRSIWIELKAPGRQPTPLQAETLRRIQAAGATAVVCRSVEEVGKALERFRGPVEGAGIRIADVEAGVKRLQNLVTAQRDLIAWYESEHDRSEQDDDNCPEEFLGLERAIKAAAAGEE